MLFDRLNSTVLWYEIPFFNYILDKKKKFFNSKQFSMVIFQHKNIQNSVWYEHNQISKNIDHRKITEITEIVLILPWTDIRI